MNKNKITGMVPYIPLKTTCGHCAWFDKGAAHGECRRYPPQVFVTKDIDGDYHQDERWPSVYTDDWCGEHKKAEAQSGSERFGV